MFFKFKIFNFALLILHFALISFVSAGAPDTLWTRTYGGPEQEGGYSVQQTIDGGFVIAGYTFSFGAGKKDVYLIRTDSNGDTLWTKTYGGTETDCGYSVHQTKDGGFIIGGETSSFGAGMGDVYLIRTNENGDTIWTKTYGGTYSDIGRSVQQTVDGGFIIAGYTTSFGASNSEVYLIRTESNGDTSWTKIYSESSGPFYHRGNYVQKTSDSGFIAVGWTNSFQGENDIYLIRTNFNGEKLWYKIYGGQNGEDGRSVQQTNDGGFIITGYTTSFGAGSEDVYLLRTNSNGDTLWTKTYGGTVRDDGSSVQQTSDSGFIITGTTWSLLDEQTNILIIKTDSKGDTLWTKTIGGDSSDIGYYVHQTSDGGFIIAGETCSFGAGVSDVYLIRLDKETVGVQEDNLANFLNPNYLILSYDCRSNLINIRYTIPHSCYVKLKVFDIQGRLIVVIQDKFLHKGSYSVKWDSKRFSAGVYFIKLSENGSSVSKKVIIR